MNRRKFFKLMAAGVTPLAISMLCNLPIETSAPTATVKPTRTPKVGTPTATALPPSATPTVGPVPAPTRGLGSNSNYLIYSDCDPIMGLSVTVEVTKDIKTDIGFSIQLNAYSPQDANCVWQQYIMMFTTSNSSPLRILQMVDNWPSDSFRQSLNLPTGSDLINTHGQLMLTLPGATLPAGYKFTISLTNDKDHNVNGVTYLIVDDKGKTTKADIRLESLFVNHTNPAKPITSDDLAPINVFELNLVGPTNGEATHFSAGAGNITYTASSPLTVLSKKPSCCAAQGVFTKESGNSAYGTLFAGPSQTITQSFDITK